MDGPQLPGMPTETPSGLSGMPSTVNPHETLPKQPASPTPGKTPRQNKKLPADVPPGKTPQETPKGTPDVYPGKNPPEER